MDASARKTTKVNEASTNSVSQYFRNKSKLLLFSLQLALSGQYNAIHEEAEDKSQAGISQENCVLRHWASGPYLIENLSTLL